MVDYSLLFEIIGFNIEWLVIAYYLRQLNTYKKNYPIHDTEGDEVFTNHQNLKYIFNRKDMNLIHQDGWHILRTVTYLFLSLEKGQYSD